MKINAEMDIPIMPKRHPHSGVHQLPDSVCTDLEVGGEGVKYIKGGGEIYKNMRQRISHRQNNMDLCCLANNFNKKLSIRGSSSQGLWAPSGNPPSPQWLHIINVLNCWLHRCKFVQ